MIKKAKKGIRDYYPDKLITNKNPRSPVSEAFRAIRTNIEFSDIDKSVQTILVTSSIPSEGKSVVTANLGVTMAMAGKRVLILDCDLRNPTMHKFHEFGNSTGVTSLLVDETLNLEDALVLPSPNLYFLSSGPLPPNPAELLGSKKMRNLIEHLKEQFDVILIDAPPVLAVTDASILASYIDGVIVVTAVGQAQKDQIKAAKEQLQKVKANILGVILNKVPEGSGYYNSYYYGHN